MAEDDSVIGQSPVGSWSVGGRPEIFFPIADITENGGNRLVRHERTYRNGAKLVNTGTKATEWAVTIVFNNSIVEPGIPEGSPPLYPTVLRELLRSIAHHDTGRLVLPTVGAVRARAETYSRKEGGDQVDTAVLTITWVQDNEEALDRAALNPPSVTATALRLSEQTTFTAQSLGVWSPDLATLRERCNELETAMKAPGRAVSDVATAARANRRAIESVLATARTELGRLGIFGEPRSSGLHNQLATLSDRIARSEDERSSSRPPTRPFVVDVEHMSMFDVSVRVNQDLAELLDLNAARVPDPFDLSRGDVIKVFVTAA